MSNNIPDNILHKAYAYYELVGPTESSHYLTRMGFSLTPNALAKRYSRWKNNNPNTELKLEEEFDPKEIARIAFAEKAQAVTKLGRANSLINFIRDEIKVLAKENPQIILQPTSYPLPTQGHEREITLVCSDWQVGKLENEIGSNAVISTRVPRIIEATKAIIRHYRSAGKSINQLNIVLAGDMIEGCWIYGGQNVYGLDRTGNTHRITRQIYTTADLVAQMVQQLSSEVSSVRVISVPGNHGRPNGPNQFADPKDNFDTLMAWWARDKCMNLSNVKFIVEEDWVHTFNIMNHNISVMHGDAWRGLLTPAIYKLLPSWVVSGAFNGITPDILLTGHRHNLEVITVSGVTVIQNGTIDGGSNYFMKSTGHSSKPTQVVFSSSIGRSLEALYPIDF